MTHAHRPAAAEDSPPAPLRSPVAIAAILLVATLVARAIGFVPSVINPDESVFALAAREVIHGHLPYLTLFDNKPVGSTLLIALFLKLFGQSVLAVRLLGALSVWAAAVLVAAIVERGGLGRVRALCAGLLVVAFTLPNGGLATMTEILLLPFTALAVLLLQRMLAPAVLGRRLLLAAGAGLACGGAILMKIVPAAPGFAVAGCVVVLLLRRHDVSLGGAAALALAFAAGAVMPMAVMIVVYAGAGQLPALLYANFGFTAAYGDIRPGVKMVAQRLSTTVDALWPLLLLGGLGVAVLTRAIRRAAVPDLLAVTGVWLVGELVAASASRHFYPHYFITAVPPLAILAVFGLKALAGWLGVGGSGSRAILLLALLAAVIPAERIWIDMLRDINAESDVAKKVARAIRKASTGHRPTLFVTNYRMTAVYSLAGAQLPPTRYAVPSHLFSRQSRMIQGDAAEETRRVLASRPEFIVTDSTDKMPGWARAQFAAVSGRYRLLRKVGTVHLFQALP